MAPNQALPAKGLRLVALLNAAAGAASHKGADGLRAELAAALDALDVVAELKFCGGSELKLLAEAALKSAKAGEIDAVVVGGGDGSIRTVAGVLAGSDVPLGILPLGTLNHFAKDLGIPLHLGEAAEVIAKGAQRAVDLAEVNGETFINNSSIGIYPYMVLDRERRRAHHKLAKWMAMVPALFRAARHFPRRRLALSAEGWTRPYRTPCLLIGNNEYGVEFPTLGRRHHLDQGKLSVYVVKQRRALGAFLDDLAHGLRQGQPGARRRKLPAEGFRGALQDKPPARGARRRSRVHAPSPALSHAAWGAPRHRAAGKFSSPPCRWLAK